ncbi:MAG: 1,2-phenylacetyl-CoA epoxidase subunit A [Brevibacillus sp.]|nr:1,2-phenylacetyl-CoA epoxidase subunit A [Brevibacillus sp.]
MNTKVAESNQDEKRAQFQARIERGEKIEADDWMPDDYRNQLIKLIAMHAVSEIMGALPEKEWVPKAPTLRRKLAIMAKVQDEVGHGQLLLRVVEDLLAPLGKTREDLFEDLFTGRLKFHNVFHMKAPTWADAGVIGWLVDGAAIITQTMSLDSSYAPYARALYRICAEEKFHAQHGESIVLELAEGTPAQRQLLQDAVNRWWPALLMFFGPPDDGTISSNQQLNMQYKIRTQTNEELRQAFFDKYVPRIFHLGLTLPDKTIRYDEAEGKWHYQQPDWEEFKQIVRGNGPRSAQRLQLRKVSYEEAKWVRDALLAKQCVAG